MTSTSSRRRLALWVSVALASSALACADRNVGQAVPGDQLYFPVGIQTLGSTSAASGQRLAILSTNFDLRYQSGQVSLLDADALLDGVLAGLGVEASDDACQASSRPLFSETFEIGASPVVLSRVRVPGVGNGITRVPVTTEEDRLYVVDRLGSTMILVERIGDGLRCATGGEIIDNTDCDEAHLTYTQAEEPLGMAYGASTGGRPVVAVAHSYAHTFFDDAFTYGIVTVFDEQLLADKAAGGAASEPFVGDIALSRAAGMVGLAYVNRARPSLLAMPLAAAGRFELSSLGLVSPSADTNGIYVVPDEVLRLDSYANAFGGRGMAVTPDGARAVLSLRFGTAGIASNSGISVVGVDEDELEPYPVAEVGEEIGPPALRPVVGDEPLLAYVGDIRSDKVFVVDVSQNIPLVAGEIIGRARRIVDGKDIEARTLDAPTGFAFARRNGKTYAFVTNFSNSTLAVLDVSSRLPSQHCLIARIGRDSDPNGQSEEERD